MNQHQKLDQNELLTILLDAYKKGQTSNTLQAADLISDIAAKLKPFVSLHSSVPDETYV
ncbi:hypothetical protein [Aneurinibacillus tyrosinisolvens]|uniref:hypothetical protein n=1 Tax=Aneurinibacillus tyrosinisolvens TaxID=1443435 RepID=UPI000ACDAAAB|nr:hypothetical protein [Aneurinibacillus tyrosinisolvens]